LNKFYSTAKVKVEKFFNENPLASPEQYMTTPEGVVIKYIAKASNDLVEKSSIKFLKRYSKKSWIKKA
jgi:hypothetical protein